MPVLATADQIENTIAIEVPNTDANAGREQQPDRMLLGPGGRTPGAAGPDLYYLVNIPNPSLFCALEL